MGYRDLNTEETKKLVGIFQRLLKNEDGKLTEETISILLKELRDAQLEMILNPLIN